MKTWHRASTVLSCGADLGCLIRSGDVYLELRAAGATWIKRRCARHAGESAPDTLGDEPRSHTTPLPFASTRQLAARFDYKAKQARDE